MGRYCAPRVTKGQLRNFASRDVLDERSITNQEIKISYNKITAKEELKIRFSF